SSTVRPWALTSRMQSWKTASIKGSRPDVGSSRSRSSASEASAATRPTFWRFPLGVHARLLGRIELEALEKLVPPPPVEVAAEPTEEIDDLSPAEVRPQAHLAGYVRETAVQRHRVAPWITAEKRDAPCVGAKEAKQDSDGRGLARAVGSEKAVDLACLNLQIEPVQS